VTVDADVPLQRVDDCETSQPERSSQRGESCGCHHPIEFPFLACSPVPACATLFNRRAPSAPLAWRAGWCARVDGLVRYAATAPHGTANELAVACLHSKFLLECRIASTSRWCDGTASAEAAEPAANRAGSDEAPGDITNRGQKEGEDRAAEEEGAAGEQARSRSDEHGSSSAAARIQKLPIALWIGTKQTAK
jgi:hypothetical protein